MPDPYTVPPEINREPIPPGFEARTTELQARLDALMAEFKVDGWCTMAMCGPKSVGLAGGDPGRASLMHTALHILLDSMAEAMRRRTAPNFPAAGST